jgi:hypothetical protein
MLGAAVVAGLLAASVAIGHAQQAQPPVVPASDVKDEAGVRTADDTVAKRLERQRAAMQRALFSSEEPLPVTLIADFKAVNRDRNPESTKVFPATLVVAGRNGGEDRIKVNIRTRGHSRRMSTTCTFAPIRIEFPEKTTGTVFEGHKSLKLGTHCRGRRLLRAVRLPRVPGLQDLQPHHRALVPRPPRVGHLRRCRDQQAGRVALRPVHRRR